MARVWQDLTNQTYVCIVLYRPAACCWIDLPSTLRTLVTIATVPTDCYWQSSDVMSRGTCEELH